MLGAEVSGLSVSFENVSLCLFFLSHLWHAEFPGLGIERAAQQLPVFIKQKEMFTHIPGLHPFLPLPHMLLSLVPN